MSCAASTFSREHILLWLPCRSHCQRSGELPSREQMPSCVREGLAWSPLSAATPLKQVLIHFGRHWAELCVAKNSFPDKSSESIPGRGWDWPHVYVIPSVPHTVQLWVLEISDRMGNSGLSIFLGIRPEILHSASSNSHVTWGSGRRLLVWRGLSTHEGKKSAISAALKSHRAGNTETRETCRMHQLETTWLPTKGFLLWPHLRSSHQDDILWLSN